MRSADAAPPAELRARGEAAALLGNGGERADALAFSAARAPFGIAHGHALAAPLELVETERVHVDARIEAQLEQILEALREKSARAPSEDSSGES